MNRILYIDNLRTGLIALVVLHHLAITYGGPGGWYYIENPPDQYSSVLYSLFLATNQAFFMGLFFFISAYFTAVSIERKTTTKFVRDRLVRLGLPLLVYYFLLSPLTIFLMVRYGRGEPVVLYEFYTRYFAFGFGPMWFVEALLYFTVLYLLYRIFFPPKTQNSVKRLPHGVWIVLCSLIVGLVTFIVRLWFPVGYVVESLGFQPPHFPQYIVMFVLGIVAYRHNWLEAIQYRQSVRWFVFAQILIFVGFPLLFVAGGAASGNTAPFMGGMTWQSLGYALWEQLVGFSLVIGLIGLFQRYLNTQTRFAGQLSAAAYMVFIIHPVILVAVCVAVKNIEIYHLMKFILLAPVTLVLCFGSAILLRRIPGVSKVV